uniref:Carboxypeptidase n=1 Tax=Clastoptera arizonana TaxID=38151 RepID=A0A1B6DKD2_9HEMI
MYFFYSFIFAFFITSKSVMGTYQNVPNSNDPGEPLLLTPYVESGKIALAQNLSKVSPFIDGIESYSGFFEVDKQYDSQMFFWFFPAINKNKSAPLILWLEGGPGVSSIYGVFEEVGPFYIQKNGKLRKRKYSWSNNHAVLYIDSPVGTGFSYTNSDAGYSTDEVHVAKNLYSTLIQFFKLFPQYQKNEFFVVGESYAGKFAPAISYAIHTNNPTANIKINLKGVALGNAYCDPEHMSSGYGDHLYQIGLIDSNALKYFRAEQAKGVALIKQKRWIDALRLLENLLGTTFYNLTGYTYNFNFVFDKEEPQFGSVFDLLQKQSILKALHVGNVTFGNTFVKINSFLEEDITQSVRPWVETLIEHYRVLVYSGQLDLSVPYINTLGFLNALNWSGTNEYKTAVRNQWYVNGQLAGYTKTAKKLTEVLVRNAGHLVPADQPYRTYELITRFTSNQKLV